MRNYCVHVVPLTTLNQCIIINVGMPNMLLKLLNLCLVFGPCSLRFGCASAGLLVGGIGVREVLLELLDCRLVVGTGLLKPRLVHGTYNFRYECASAGLFVLRIGVREVLIELLDFHLVVCTDLLMLLNCCAVIGANLLILSSYVCGAHLQLLDIFLVCFLGASAADRLAFPGSVSGGNHRLGRGIMGENPANALDGQNSRCQAEVEA
ncbi:hypothetical protein BX661DRAFT_178941 [Kickxella alabastrina]|uniref:uncharacterized protein n=1 Tax=Kickxella alabastrina TaxID=61397 RepID=UPI00221FEBFE|nr:uncharacterized protein BX661DRAFT_178941 [Kickxella alabastrina]KAI7833004.1 hypothetical protein BX661DRAFT_178941 [Kickxella alabastrina]